MAISPKCPDSTNVVLGEGKIYVNYGEAGQAELGATRGGSTFTVERDIKEVAYDGAYGKTKGKRRKLTVNPMLVVNMLELNYTNIPQAYAGMTVTDEGAYHKIIEDIDLVDGDYLTNVAFVGERMDGKAVIIIINNALGDGNVEWALTEKEEVVAETTFSGHYDCASPTVVPYEIRLND